jgi:hypothetical protein
LRRLYLGVAEHEGADGFGGFGLEKSPSTQLTPLAPIKPDGCHE